MAEGRTLEPGEETAVMDTIRKSGGTEGKSKAF